MIERPGLAECRCRPRLTIHLGQLRLINFLPAEPRSISAAPDSARSPAFADLPPPETEGIREIIGGPGHSVGRRFFPGILPGGAGPALIKPRRLAIDKRAEKGEGDGDN